MMELFVTAFVTLFVIIDPIGIAPIFAALTEKADKAFQRKMAIKGTLVAGIILGFFAIAGKPFLAALGISMDALRIAGGFMLLLIALEMVYQKRDERRQQQAEALDEVFEDISVFPIAIPLLAGPGAMATVMLLMSETADSIEEQLVIGGSLLLVLLINMITFFFAGRMMKALGSDVNAVLTRVLGIILAALAVQFMLDGLKATLI